MVPIVTRTVGFLIRKGVRVIGCCSDLGYNAFSSQRHSTTIMDVSLCAIWPELSRPTDNVRVLEDES